MVDMFGECTLHGVSNLQKQSMHGKPVEMENFFSRLALDIIGKAVFNYEFDSLTTDDPVIKVCWGCGGVGRVGGVGCVGCVGVE